MNSSMVSGTGYEVILDVILAGMFAQVFKMTVGILKQKRLNFRVLVQTGGMPSSHSSTMMAMAAGVGLISGWASVDFAIALGVAVVVMYDAAGLRRAAGRMAGILNSMTEDFYQHQPERIPERLRELLGHTPFEVFVGALFGTGLAIVVHDLLAQF